jgi:hypothetical protein
MGHAVQSHVVGVYALHASLGSCGAQHLLAQLDDAISDTMREWAQAVQGNCWAVLMAADTVQQRPGTTHTNATAVVQRSSRQQLAYA